MSCRTPPPLSPAISRLVSSSDESGPLHVLVVGGTLPALVLSRLLVRAGHRPTVVAPRRVTAAPDGPTLVPDGTVTTLDRWLVDIDVRALTRPAHGRHVACPENEVSYRPRDGTPHVADYEQLYRSLVCAVENERRQVGSVEHIQQTSAAVDVTFEDGEETSFDLVVGADGPHSFLGSLNGTVHDVRTGLHEWTTTAPATPELDGSTVERWTPSFGLTVTPHHDELAVQVRLPSHTDPDRSPQARATSLLGDLDGPLSDVLQDGLPAGSSYRRLPDPTASSTWRVGRVAFLGTTASPLWSVRGLHPTLSLEDAGVLVESLTTTETVEAALGAFATDRRARDRSVRSAARRAVPDWVVTSGAPPALELARRARAVRLDGQFELSSRPD